MQIAFKFWANQKGDACTPCFLGGWGVRFSAGESWINQRRCCHAIEHLSRFQQVYILLSHNTLCSHYPLSSTSTNDAFNINCTQSGFVYSHIRRSTKHLDRCSKTVAVYMFSTRQQCCKAGKSTTRELPAPSHFALQRWYVCLLFFPFSSLLASLYTLNCTESFDGGWEERECHVEVERNWALTLIRWRTNEEKKSAS